MIQSCLAGIVSVETLEVKWLSHVPECITVVRTHLAGSAVITLLWLMALCNAKCAFTHPRFLIGSAASIQDTSVSVTAERFTFTNLIPLVVTCVTAAMHYHKHQVSRHLVLLSWCHGRAHGALVYRILDKLIVLLHEAFKSFISFRGHLSSHIFLCFSFLLLFCFALFVLSLFVVVSIFVFWSRGSYE